MLPVKTLELSPHSWPSYYLPALAASVALLLSGCGEEPLQTQYGTRFGQSVNGTNVLVEMVRQRGHEVATRRRVSRALERSAEVFFWTPSSNFPIGRAHRFFEGWLARRPGRILVFVAPGYDAAPGYWFKAALKAPTDHQRRYSEKQFLAAELAKLNRSLLPDYQDCGWFVFKKKQSSSGGNLGGDPTWRGGLRANDLEIESYGRLSPDPIGGDVLLSVADDPVISRVRVLCETGGFSYVLIVSNGSFLLNLPQVNHQHRQLTGKLLDEIERLRTLENPNLTSHVLTTETGAFEGNSSSPLVVFLEGEDPTGQSQDDPGRNPYSFLFKPPLSYFFFQLALGGVVFAFARWPIPARPRSGKQESLRDFGRHVAAVGELLEQTGDRSYAQQRLDYYHLHVRDGVRGQHVRGGMNRETEELTDSPKSPR